jgi:hypothetical protein
MTWRLQCSGTVGCHGVAFRPPRAAIPQDHRARAVFPFRDGALEARVLERMILHVDRQTLVGGSRLGPFGIAQLLRVPSSSRRKS